MHTLCHSCGFFCTSLCSLEGSFLGGKPQGGLLDHPLKRHSWLVILSQTLSFLKALIMICDCFVFLLSSVSPFSWQSFHTDKLRSVPLYPQCPAPCLGTEQMFSKILSSTEKPFWWWHLQQSGTLYLFLNFDPQVALLLINKKLFFGSMAENRTGGLGQLANMGLCGNHLPVQLRHISTLNLDMSF